jgi:hypothetical protein
MPPGRAAHNTPGHGALAGAGTGKRAGGTGMPSHSAACASAGLTRCGCAWRRVSPGRGPTPGLRCGSSVRHCPPVKRLDVSMQAPQNWCRSQRFSKRIVSPQPSRKRLRASFVATPGPALCGRGAHLRAVAAAAHHSRVAREPWHRRRFLLPAQHSLALPPSNPVTFHASPFVDSCGSSLRDPTRRCASACRRSSAASTGSAAVRPLPPPQPVLRCVWNFGTTLPQKIVDFSIAPQKIK